MTTTKEILFLIAVIIGTALLGGLLPDFSGKDIVVYGTLIVILAIHYFRNLTKFKKARQAENTTDRVEITPGVTFAPLTGADLKRLRKVRNRKLASIAFVFLAPFVIVLVFIHFFFPQFWPQGGSALAWALTVLIGIFGVAYFYRQLIKFRQQLQDGKKTVVVGYVSMKQIHDADSHEYLLCVEGYDVIVNWNLFEKYAKGDAMEVHLFEPWENLLLFERKM